MKLTARDIWNEVKDYTIITLGLMCYTFGWTAFLVSNEIITGGVTGLSALIFSGPKYLFLYHTLPSTAFCSSPPFGLSDGNIAYVPYSE